MAENEASSWFRCYMWMDALRKLGHKAFYDTYGRDDVTPAVLEKMTADVDVVVAGRTASPMFFAGLLAAREVHKFKLIIDTDDLVRALHPAHPSLANFHSATGVVRLAYAQFRMADGVTVSTPRLLEDTQKHNPRTYLFRNSVWPSAWNTVRSREKESRHKDDFRIYWGGGASHYADLLIARPALERLVREDIRVKLIFQNFIPDWAIHLPANQAFYVPFVDFHGYYKVFKWLCADVAIAPLEPNEHNLCKSDVKFLDYAMAEVPGVYQRVEPYETVADGATGLLAGSSDEWYEKLRAYKEHRELRVEVARRAKRYVLAKRDAMFEARRYEAMLNEVVGSKGPQPEARMLIEGKPIEATQWLQS